MHPRYRKHGGEKGTALGGGVSLEPATKNLVEILRIAQELSSWGSSYCFGFTKRKDEWTPSRTRVRKACFRYFVMDWNAMRNSEQPSSLGIVHGMSGCLISAGCSTAHGPRLQTNSSPMNTGTLPRLFGVSCGSRGHWFESGIHQALLGYGLSPLAQLEIEILHEDVPIKAHLDFTLETGTPQPFVRILEVKSTSKLPTTLPESHAMQIGAQTALLKVCWNQPVFNLVQENGEVIYHKTFPEICNEWLGVRLPDVSACDIQGWILCLSMSDAKVFGPFLPEDTDLARCLAMASEFWATLNELRSNRLNLDDIQTTQGLAPLCPSCSWRKDCPHFKSSSHPEWEDTLVQFIKLKKQKKSIEKEIGELESRLKVAYQLSHTVRGEWINTGNHTFRVIPQNGRVTVDRKRLAEELNTLLGEQNAQTLMARCEKQGEPFERLYAIRMEKAELQLDSLIKNT